MEPLKLSYLYFYSFEILIFAFSSFLALFFIDPKIFPLARNSPDLWFFCFYSEIGPKCRSHRQHGSHRGTRENNLYTFGVGSGSEAEPESGLPMGEKERKRDREWRDKDGLGCACSLARAKRRYKPFRTVHIAARCHRGNTVSRVLLCPSEEILCRTNSCCLPSSSLNLVAF